MIGGTTTGNILDQDPLLGSLQNNGGSTQTQAPLVGSPTIDHGDNAGCPAIDQRGWHRPIGLSCDIGAVEAGLLVYLPLIQSEINRILIMHVQQWELLNRAR